MIFLHVTPAQQNQSAQVQSFMGITALSIYYQTSTAALLSQAKATPNQVPIYTPKSATVLYLNQIPVYATDLALVPNLHPVLAHIPEPVLAPAPNLVFIYKTNAVQPIQNGYLSKKHKYQQLQATYKTQATITTITTKATIYVQAVSFQ